MARCLRPRTLHALVRSRSPAALQVESMSYPETHPDPSVFEQVSREYTSVENTRSFTPLTSSDALKSLVANGHFAAAESLRNEMSSHHIPIQRDVLYLRAALHALAARHSKQSVDVRADSFVAWLSLSPDRCERFHSFYDIRQKIFLSMDHVNLTLIYRFGLALASKGYCSGDAAVQVLSTLARYASPSVVQRYLRDMEDASADYHSRNDVIESPDSFVDAYSLAIRTVALAGRTNGALGLIDTARTRGLVIPDFTLNMVAKPAPDQRKTMDHIQASTLQGTSTSANHLNNKIPVDDTDDISALAARLRALRSAFRSPRPPSPDALQSFVASYHRLGRTRALTLLRTVAYRYSLKSISTWAFTEMLYHRNRRHPLSILRVYADHFYPIGIPHKTVLSLIRGTVGRQRTGPEHQWAAAGQGRLASMRLPRRTKVWPTAYHTALVWEAVLALSPKTEHQRLYSLLLSLVRQSRADAPLEPWPQSDSNAGERSEEKEERRFRVQLQLPPDTFDATHFSPFVSLWANDPKRATSVLRDMVWLGVEPSIVQWSILARGHAQRGDPGVAMQILDRFGDKSKGGEEETRHVKGMNADSLLGIHTNVLRGFVLAGDLQHARQVETRLFDWFGYRVGDRPMTDASIALLRQLEVASGS